MEHNHPYKTILTIIAGFLVLFYFTGNKWLLYVVILLAILSLLSKKLSLFIEQIWFAIGKVMSKVIPSIILFVLFIVIITPMAIFMRFVQGYNPLEKKDSRDSMFKDVDRVFDAAFFEKPW